MKEVAYVRLNWSLSLSGLSMALLFRSRGTAVGTADAEIKAPFAENPELSKLSLFTPKKIGIYIYIYTSVA